MCTINNVSKQSTITVMAITNTTIYSGSEPSCLLHPLPKITTWEFHYIHPEYSRVVFIGSQLKPHLVFNRLTKNLTWFSTGSPRTSVGFKGSPTTSVGFKANQQPLLVSKAHQQPQMVSKANQQPLLVSKAHQQPFLVLRLTKNLIQEI